MRSTAGQGEFFFSELESDRAAEQALAAFHSEKEHWAEISDVPAGFRFEHPNAGSGIVIRVGRFVAGVQGDLGFENQDELLTELRRRLEG